MKFTSTAMWLWRWRSTSPCSRTFSGSRVSASRLCVQLVTFGSRVLCAMQMALSRSRMLCHRTSKHFTADWLRVCVYLFVCLLCARAEFLRRYHDFVNDSVFTNVGASLTLNLTIAWANLLGVAVPPTYASVAAGLRVLYDAQLGVHLEYEGFAGEKIKQADVVLLGFPMRKLFLEHNSLSSILFHSGLFF